MRLTITMALILSVSTFSFSQSTVVNTIKQLNSAMEDSFNKNDMQTVASFYMDSAVISGGRMRITGRSGINNYWVMMKDGGYNWKLETDRIEDYDRIVIQNGRSSLTNPDRQMNTRFLLIWKKVGDSYKIIYDLFSPL